MILGGSWLVANREFSAPGMLCLGGCSKELNCFLCPDTIIINNESCIPNQTGAASTNNPLQQIAVDLPGKAASVLALLPIRACVRLADCTPHDGDTWTHKTHFTANRKEGPYICSKKMHIISRKTFPEIHKFTTPFQLERGERREDRGEERRA